MILIINPCDKHKTEGTKEEKKLCKDCKKEYMGFI